jgi:glucose-fructose oxidoreductase
MKRNRRIRYAVVGLGHLSQYAILPAFARCKSAELGALITDDVKKAKVFGHEYRAPVFGYDQFEAALKAEEIDAAFIVLPNHLHCEYTERAAKAGVNVLCEKPMAVTVSEGKAMIRACEKAKVKLMIAYRLHFTEAAMRAVELAQSGELGEMRLYNSVFAMQVQKGNIRTKAALGGGPLLDIGVYCINAARYLFGEDPVEVTAMAASSGDARFKEIDEMVSAVLRFPKDRLASFSCSFGAHDISEFHLLGTKAFLHSQAAFDYSAPLRWSVRTVKGTKQKEFVRGDQFAAEMDYFAECIQKDREPEPSGIEGLIDLQIIEAINHSRRTRKAVMLRLPKKTQRPGPKLIVKRSTPKREPKLVDAHSPHR